MTDLGKTIAPKSDQLNADDLISGPRTITITKVASGSKDQPINISFEGDNGKPYRPGKSMRRVLVYVWGVKGDDYLGRSMTIYCDENVKFGGIAVGGIRISHMSHMDAAMTFPLTTSRARRSPYTVKPLKVANDPADIEKAQNLARNAANRGKVAFSEWWKSDEGKKNRNLVKSIMDELQTLTAKADDAAKNDDEKPADQPDDDEKDWPGA